MAFSRLILAVGVYAGLISLLNRYLREHALLNQFTQITLMVVLAIGLYRIYRWFCHRLDSISNQK